MNNIYKIIDVNINRVIEGIRVIEEYFRFIKSNNALVIETKKFREKIVKSLDYIDYDQCLMNRDISVDKAKFLNTNNEMHKNDIMQIIKANSFRIKEALRVLEEYGKIVNTDFAVSIKEIRFEYYSFEQNIQIKINGADET